MNLIVASMYIEVIKSKKEKKTYRTTLIRESYRKNKKVLHRTVANISKLSTGFIQQIRQIISGENVCFEKIENIRNQDSKEHGASYTLLSLARRINLDTIIYSKKTQWREDILAMIVGRIIYQGSKLYLTNIYAETTLWTQCGHLSSSKPDVHENCYKPLDELLKRQKLIQRKLAKSHLKDGCMVLYDMTNLYAEGEYKNSELVDYGKNKEKKKGYKQIAVGLITNHEGCPVAIEVFRGNTSDQTTVQEQAKQLAHDFKIKKVVFIGDRGMLTPKRIDEVNELDFKTLTALTHPQIQSLIENKTIDKNKFIDDKIGEVTDIENPEINYMLCRNPKNASKSTHTRERLMSGTIDGLEKMRLSKRKRSDQNICASIGRLLAKYKVGKFFKWEVENGVLTYVIDQEKVAKDQAIDGCYVIRSDIDSSEIDGKEAVSSYKSLIHVEKAFRNLKTVQIESRPFYHKTDDRIKSHVFLCMLSYYIQWHARKILDPLFKENGKFKNRRWSMHSVIEHLKSLRKSNIFIGKVGPIETISTPNSSQQKLLDLFQVKL